MTGIEQRKYQRFVTAKPVRTRVRNEKTGMICIYYANILNVSKGGFCLQSPFAAGCGDTLKIKLSSQDIEGLVSGSLQGQVVWRSFGRDLNYKYGLKFTD